MSQRIPVTTVDELDSLPFQEEIVEGYWDGRRNEPCGDNRSRAYWHGWRNGMSDGHHAKVDTAGMALAKDFLRHQKERRRA